MACLRKRWHVFGRERGLLKEQKNIGNPSLPFVICLSRARSVSDPETRTDLIFAGEREKKYLVSVSFIAPTWTPLPLNIFFKTSAILFFLLIFPSYQLQFVIIFISFAFITFYTFLLYGSLRNENKQIRIEETEKKEREGREEIEITSSKKRKKEETRKLYTSLTIKA